MKFKVKGHGPIGVAAPHSHDQVLLRREILARGRVIDKHHVRIKHVRSKRMNALHLKQAMSRFALIVTGLLILVIFVRLVNDTIYFVTGLDPHLFNGLIF